MRKSVIHIWGGSNLFKNKISLILSESGLFYKLNSDLLLSSVFLNIVSTLNKGVNNFYKFEKLYFLVSSKLRKPNYLPI